MIYKILGLVVLAWWIVGSVSVGIWGYRTQGVTMRRVTDWIAVAIVGFTGLFSLRILIKDWNKSGRYVRHHEDI